MLRTATWTYGWNATDVDELYHLGEDPHELHNRSADPACAGVLDRLRRELYDALVAQGDRQVDNHWVRRQFLDGATS